MCVEEWSIGKTGWACVRVKGRLTRNMEPTETICDIKFDYIEYPIKILIGKYNEDANKVKFEETVNFDKLR